MDNADNKGYLFIVEVLIEDATNGQALEKLLHILNSNLVKDYQIKTGMELGKLIELNTRSKSASAEIQPKPIEAEQSKPGTTIQEQLEHFKKNNSLIRLTIVKRHGIKLSLPCRILNYDADLQHVTVYHVDEKKVYSFNLNEIDDYDLR